MGNFSPSHLNDELGITKQMTLGKTSKIPTKHVQEETANQNTYGYKRKGEEGKGLTRMIMYWKVLHGDAVRGSR